jgi:hypothetical protein
MGLYVAAYRTPPREAEDGLDNLGLLYAIESSVMDFEMFSRVTRERNATLSARLDFGAATVFNTPEEGRHSFTFRLLKEGAKYATRIFEMDVCTTSAKSSGSTPRSSHSRRSPAPSGCGLGAVNKYLQAARRAGLSWPLTDELTDARLR